MSGGTPVEITSYRKGGETGARERRTLVPEGPLAIEIVGGATYTILRSPGQDRELALGFLAGEGVVGDKSEVALIRACPEDENRLLVNLAEGKEPAPGRKLSVASSCGLCGHADLEGLVKSLKRVNGGMRVERRVLYELPGKVRSGQSLFRATGASHAAAIFDAEGSLLALFEDIGRHNAFDKAVGHCLEKDIPLAGCGAFLSGRVSLEMMVKAARARIPLVAAVSAPSAPAVELAEELGITLCGFVRGEEITVYAHPERLE